MSLSLVFQNTCSIYIHHINALIQGKQAHLMHLRQDVFLQKQLAMVTKSYFIKKKFKISKQDRKGDLFYFTKCFLKEKQHVVDLFYDNSFNEKQISTKARHIQINAELQQHYRLEINDLESKGLIQKSKSP